MALKPTFGFSQKLISQINDRPTMENDVPKEVKKSKYEEANVYKWNIVWKNVIKFSFLHLVMFYGLFLTLTLKTKWQTTVFNYFYVMFGMFGVTAGTHRLWSHRCFKANVPLRIFLMLAQSSTLQNDIHTWVRDHRLHHKYTDTNADPHNATRGLFYSHIGWLLLRKNSDVLTKGKTIDMSDILADPVVMYQMKYYPLLTTFWCFTLPTLIPWYFWTEDFWYSFAISIARFTFTLNITFLVNSFAHVFGMRPYDKFILPRENKFVSFMAFGEGWHNYHHTFPWDYKTSELGNYGLNFTTCFIDIMAKIGWATNLKSASTEIIRQRIVRTGDGSYYTNGDDMNGLIKEVQKHTILDSRPEKIANSYGETKMQDK